MGREGEVGGEGGAVDGAGAGEGEGVLGKRARVPGRERERATVSGAYGCGCDHVDEWCFRALPPLLLGILHPLLMVALFWCHYDGLVCAALTEKRLALIFFNSTGNARIIELRME